MIELRFTLTPDEYLEGLNALQRDVKRLLRQSRWSFAALLQWAALSIVLLTALVVFSLWYTPAPTAPASASPAVETDARPLQFFLGMFVVIFLFALFRGLRARRRLFQQIQKSADRLTQDRLVRLEAAGVQMSNAIAATTYRWEAFIRLTETRHVFILQLSEASGEMIPKRAFTDAAQQEEFRQMVGVGLSRAQAFPVIPIASVAVSTQPAARTESV
jgi:hypothetical protein